MKKTRQFIHVGDIARGPEDMFDAGTVVLVDKCRFDDLRYPVSRERSLVAPDQLARQIRDETRTPFAVAVRVPNADDCFYPVFLEVEADQDGKQRVLSLRIHLHADAKERGKTPRTHRKK